MLLVPPITHFFQVIFVRVHLDSMVHSVKLIIDHVNQILVGTMVFYLFLPLSKKKSLFPGICNETSNTTFNCSCPEGWIGDHCEVKQDYCAKVKCLNNGVCRSLFLNYSCECLGTSYSGRNCEITSKTTAVFKIVSKSCGYIAILSLTLVVGFIVVMDILKYGFGIDPVKDDLERIRRKKQAKKAKRAPVVQRFIYINAPPPSQTIAETSV
jgi:hypothetical protein